MNQKPRMKGMGALLAVASLATLLTSCSTLGASPRGETPAVPSPTPRGTFADSDLEAFLEAPASLPSGDEVKVRFTLINNTDAGLYVLQWFTPFEGLGGEIFRVMRDGQPIPYEGPLASRGDPSPEAYLYLDAGASLSATVDLAHTYDFSKAGEYTIAFLSPRNSHVARTEGEMAESVDDLGPVAMPCNLVAITIEKDL